MSGFLKLKNLFFLRSHIINRKMSATFYDSKQGTKYCKLVILVYIANTEKLSLRSEYYIEQETN